MVQTHKDCEHIRSYLMVNNTAVRMEAFSIKDMKATFTIQGAAMRDSGEYNCVVFPSRCVQEEDAKFSGKNTVTVSVKGAGSHCAFIDSISAFFHLFGALGTFLYWKKSCRMPQTKTRMIKWHFHSLWLTFLWKQSFSNGMLRFTPNKWNLVVFHCTPDTISQYTHVPKNTDLSKTYKFPYLPLNSVLKNIVWSQNANKTRTWSAYPVLLFQNMRLTGELWPLDCSAHWW